MSNNFDVAYADIDSLLGLKNTKKFREIENASEELVIEELKDVSRISMRPYLKELNYKETRDKILDDLTPLLTASIKKYPTLYVLPISDDMNNTSDVLDANLIVLDIHMFLIGKQNKFKILRTVANLSGEFVSQEEINL